MNRLLVYVGSGFLVTAALAIVVIAMVLPRSSTNTEEVRPSSERGSASTAPEDQSPRPKAEGRVGSRDQAPSVDSAKSKVSEEGQFHLAHLYPDGTVLALHEWNTAQLSPKWLSFAKMLIDENGPNFRVSLGGKLSHLEVKLTMLNGVGLGTLFANKQIAMSTAYFNGDNPTAEREVETMFLESIRRMTGRGQPTSLTDQLETIRERPLHVVVVWDNPQVSQQDFELIREFANHLAGALLFPAAAPENRNNAN